MSRNYSQRTVFSFSGPRAKHGRGNRKGSPSRLTAYAYRGHGHATIMVETDAVLVWYPTQATSGTSSQGQAGTCHSTWYLMVGQRNGLT